MRACCPKRASARLCQTTLRIYKVSITLTIKKVRYFETSRGVGYEAKTDKGSIWNDGQGGETYFRPDEPYRINDERFHDLTDEYLEYLLDQYEGVTRVQEAF